TDGSILYLVPDASVTIVRKTDASGVGVGINDPTQIQLAASAADANNRIAVPLSSGGSGSFTLPVPNSNVTAYVDSSTVTSTNGRVLVVAGMDDPALLSDPGPIAASNQSVNPNTDVTPSDDAIHFSSPHGLTTGQEVVYHNGGNGNQSIGGLQDGHTYYAIVEDPTTIKLASTYAHAVAGTPVTDN